MSSPVTESIKILTALAEGSERVAQHHRFQMVMCTPVKVGGVLHQIQEMHRGDAEKAEALARDYRAALELLRQPCQCGEMLTGAVDKCPLHPEVRLRTQDEKIAFRLAWDSLVIS